MLIRIAVLLAMAYTVAAQAQNEQGVEIALNLSEGSTYWRKQTDSQVTRTSAGDEDMVIRRITSVTCILEVASVGSDGAVTGDLIFAEVTSDETQGAQRRTFDSRTDPAEQGVAITPFAYFLNKAIMVRIDPSGQVLAVQDFDQYPAAQAQEMSAIVKQFLERAFSYLPPDPVSVGETWKSKETLKGPIPIEIDATNELLVLNEDSFQVETNTDIRVTEDELPQAVPVREFTGKMATLVTADRGNGWVRKATIYNKLEGEGRVANPETGEELSLTVTTTSEGTIEGGTGAPPAEEPDAL